MVTTVSDESSKAYLQMCVCVYSSRRIFAEFWKGLKVVLKKIQKVAFSVGKKKFL